MEPEDLPDDYNQLRSIASEHDVELGRNPSQEELEEALRDYFDSDKGSEVEEQDAEAADGGEEDIPIKPSKQAEGTLLDHGGDDGELEMNESGDEGEEGDEQDGSDTGQASDEVEVDDESLAENIQIGLNRLQRIAGDMFLGVKPRRLSRDEVSDSVPAVREILDLIIPEGAGGAGKFALAMTAASPHIEAWRDALQDQAEQEKDGDSGDENQGGEDAESELEEPGQDEEPPSEIQVVR